MQTNLNVNYMDWLKSLRPSCTIAVNTKSTQPYQLWLSSHLIRFPELCTRSIQYQMLRNGGDCPSSPRRQSSEQRARCSELSRFDFGGRRPARHRPKHMPPLFPGGPPQPPEASPKSSPLCLFMSSASNLNLTCIRIHRYFFHTLTKGSLFQDFSISFHIHT